MASESVVFGICHINLKFLALVKSAMKAILYSKYMFDPAFITFHKSFKIS